MENKITPNDVEKIYAKIEKTKKGSFYIDHSKTIEPAIANHIDDKIASFFKDGAKNGFDKDMLKKSGAKAQELIREYNFGVEYDIKASDLIIDDVVNAQVRDDNSGTIGSIAITDSYFNDDMVKASKELDRILESA